MRTHKDYGGLEWKHFSLLCSIISVYNMFIYTTNVMAMENQSKKHYVAAVVEYAPVRLDAPRKTILVNLAQYEKIINNASQYNVDIIVLPEAGLTTVQIVERDRNWAKKYLIDVPSPESSARPCSNTSFDEILQRLSCAAKNNKMYVAVNVGEIAPCTDDSDELCPEDGAYFYNTNIVFDREGTVIARYRKFNLFGERTNNAPQEADLCTFETDFDVTFGMFLCFDIMFIEPSLRLVKKKRVTDIIFSAAWFSELPLLTALSVQAGWAYSLDVNLLAAVYDDVDIRAGGSGIYAGRRGPLVAYMPQKTSTKLLIATIPKKNVADLSERCSLKDECPVESNKFSSSSILSIDRDDNTTLISDTEMTYMCDLSLPFFEVQPLQCEHASRDSAGGETIRNTFAHENANNFSCTVEVAWRHKIVYDDRDYRNYRMIAFSGERNFSTASRNFVEVCGLIWGGRDGGGDDVDFCRVPNLESSNVEIESVKIRMKSYNVSSVAIPSAFDRSMYPLDVAHFTFNGFLATEEGGVEFYSIEMNLTRPTTHLRTFAIYKLPSDPASAHKKPQ